MNLQVDPEAAALHSGHELQLGNGAAAIRILGKIVA